MQSCLRETFLVLLLMGLTSCAMQAPRTAGPVNLALHQPVMASSFENDEHTAAMANDGDDDTCWIADDEPEGVADWWQVDLGKPTDLVFCTIRFPYPSANYRFRMDGSVDQQNWRVICDQTQTTETAQTRGLYLQDARQIRYVRVTLTGFDEGCGAAISEVAIFGSFTRTNSQP